MCKAGGQKAALSAFCGAQSARALPQGAWAFESEMVAYTPTIAVAKASALTRSMGALCAHVNARCTP
jgi:hypothetical protein